MSSNKEPEKKYQRMISATVINTPKDGWLMDGDLISFSEDGRYKILHFAEPKSTPERDAKKC